MAHTEEALVVCVGTREAEFNLIPKQLQFVQKKHLPQANKRAYMITANMFMCNLIWQTE